MDIDIEARIDEAIGRLRKLSVGDVDYGRMDPVAKMMLVALINECQKIQDDVDNIAKRIEDRYSSDFIPNEHINAVPAIALVCPAFKPKKDLGMVYAGSGSTFTYKVADSKQTLNYIPLFNTALLPHSGLYVLTPNRLTYGQNSRMVSMGSTNSLWIGICTNAEIDCMQGLSLLITGTRGILPKHIYVGGVKTELDFSTMQEMENIVMAEPFDAQQSSGKFFSFVNVWKEKLLNMEEAGLVYITETLHDRDVFKPRAYPKIFQQWLEDEVLDCFEPNTLWLQLEFPSGYVVPQDCGVMVNVVPVVNVDVNSLTLTQTAPIAKLQKQEGAFFLKVLETSSASHRQGFDMTKDEIIVRDYDASCYHNGDLYRDVRRLYNRFVDDYYAFIEYNGIKDGEVLKVLRETINRLGKSVGQSNAKYKFDSGTYVMKNMDQYPQSSSTKVSYISTQGKIGNSPRAGEVMENKKLPALEKEVGVVVAAMGGADKATADEHYELLRYYALTNDRLYTKMDVEAFLRKELLAEFGKTEFERINIRIAIEGTGGPSSLQRGLHIDIEFKDKKNYEAAERASYDKLIRQKIEGKSCIAMPIIVRMINLDKEM